MHFIHHVSQVLVFIMRISYVWTVSVFLHVLYHQPCEPDLRLVWQLATKSKKKCQNGQCPVPGKFQANPVRLSVRDWFKLFRSFGFSPNAHFSNRPVAEGGLRGQCPPHPEIKLKSCPPYYNHRVCCRKTYFYQIFKSCDQKLSP